MGVEVEHEPGAESARGVLRVSPQPFPTLDAPLAVEAVGFYTVGHSRLKFCQPRPFFDLPAIDVSRCETERDIERALRQEWASVQRDLHVARDWLTRLGALHRIARHGTRLRLLPEHGEGVPGEVRSHTEILLPSTGPLSDRSLRSPAQRRLRPLASLDHPAELHLSLASAAQERAQQVARVRVTPAPAAPERPRPEPGAPQPRVLLLAADHALLRELDTELRLRGAAAQAFRDPRRALGAFDQHSFDLVVVETRIPRFDGFELARTFRDLPGIEEMPIALLDDRETPWSRAAAREAGVSRYLLKSQSPARLAESLVELLRPGRRRFRRYGARLAVSTPGELHQDLTELVGRGGLCLRTRREPRIGSVETYRIELPSVPEPIEVRGEIVTRATLPGYAAVLAGVRFFGFLDPAAEARWIRAIQTLARRRVPASR
jgi:DNA-binding response OmpR family regulator